MSNTRREPFTQEEEERICEDYKNPANKVGEIIEIYGLSDHNHLARILAKYGVPKRRANYKRKTADGASRPVLRKCEKCRREIDNPAARFCWYCDADVRTRNVKAADGLLKILTNMELVSPSFRDEASAAIREAVDVLKEN